MNILALGYVGISTDQLDDWLDYGVNLLGLQQVDASARSVAFRMDDRRQRLHVEKDGLEGCRFFGWEMAGTTPLQRAAGEVEAHGLSVSSGARTARGGQPRTPSDVHAFAYFLEDHRGEISARDIAAYRGRTAPRSWLAKDADDLMWCTTRTRGLRHRHGASLDM